MKTFIISLFLAAALLGDVVLWQRVDSLTAAMAAANAPKDYPLAATMGYLQRCADKLWFAAEAGNWELARYYQDEIAHTADEVAAAHVVDNGLDVSATLHTMLPPVVASLGEAVAGRNPALFRERYPAMIASCNACHESAKRPFIRVTAPVGPPNYWNQQFASP